MDDFDLDDLTIEDLYEVLVEMKRKGEIEHLPGKKLASEIYDIWGLDYLAEALTDEAVLDFLALSSLIVRYNPECSVDEFDEWVRLYEKEGYEALSKKPLQALHLH